MNPDLGPHPFILITAGPTHEPIDAVRFLGNRSSGRMGIALANAAAARGLPTTLLLGPSPLVPDSSVNLHRFTTTADIEQLLKTHAPPADILIMAAAVADYRPKPLAALSGGKFRRTSEPVSLELEATPDLLAQASKARRENQLFIGFALEPRAEMLASARGKLERKNIDICIANPLETLDAPDIEAVALHRDGRVQSPESRLFKADFARWLLEQCILPAYAQRAARGR